MYKTYMYNSARIPALMNYEAAKQHYESVVPIRGRYPEVRPLGKKRRYSDMQIIEKVIAVESEHPLGAFSKSYIARLYSTDCVEFYPDGTLAIRVNNWRGPTTMGFLTHTLEHFGGIGSASGKWYFTNKGGESFPMPTNEQTELVIKFVDGHGYRPIHIKPEYKYRARRKVLNAYRRQYSEFIEYARTMLAMDKKVTPAKEIQESLGIGNNLHGRWDYRDEPTSEENRSKVFWLLDRAMADKDLDMTFKLAQHLAQRFGYYSYSSRHGECSPSTFVMAFSELLKYQFADEVFEPVEQEIGFAFFDRNAKYVENK